MKRLVSLLLLVGCSKAPSPWEKVGVRVVDGKPQLGEVEIELGRTTCEGVCPEYTVKLCGDGRLIYTGKTFVKTTGEHEATFDPEKLLPLLQRLAELDFLSDKHACSIGGIDNDHAWVTLRIGARSSTVWDAVTGTLDLLIPVIPNISTDEVLWHRKMIELENAIDALSGSDFWVGTQAERAAHGSEWR